ncbi:hypothetical protein [Rhodopseudomonas sp. RCAM05734]|uniref:hypothetical protein n=1 Tax=Rhodopseudomonas sp. RCAM05734 TaxID=3457549 RepID=UPI004044F3B6
MNLPELTLLFLATIFGLATAFIWMFCELDRHVARRRALVLRTPPDKSHRR